MKKEWFAVILLLLVALSAVLNLRYLKSCTQRLDAQVAEAVSQADSGHWAAAEDLARSAMRNWSEMDRYTHIFIRHGIIDEVSNDFCSLLGTLRSKDAGSLFAAQLTLRSHLAELYEMERIKPGSIL